MESGEKKLEKLKKLSVILLSILILFTGCTSKNIEQKTIKGKYFFLNSILQIKIYDDIPEEKKNEIYDKIEQRVSNLESMMTNKSDTSDISKINQKSGIEPVKVSQDVFNVIERSIYFSDLSQGAFDITIGKLSTLWDIGSNDERVPDEKEIKEALKYVDYKKIVLDKQKSTVYLKQKGMVIDLGAIAKGYVADVINDMLNKENISHAIINLGGNVYVHGDKNGKDLFKVAIRNPFSQDPSSYMMIYKTKNESIVTSGIYERFFIKDKKRYHHILSTKNGYPVENNLMSSTIITKNSMDADALSTIVFVKGIDKGYEIVKNFKHNTDVMFITKDKKIYITENAKENSIIKDENFKIEKILK